MNLYVEQKQTHRLKNPRGQVEERGNELGIWDWHMYTVVHGMTGQCGTAIQQRELYPIFCDGL